MTIMEILWHILNANDQGKVCEYSQLAAVKTTTAMMMCSTIHANECQFCSFLIQPTANTAPTCSKPSSEQVLQGRTTSGLQD